MGAAAIAMEAPPAARSAARVVSGVFISESFRAQFEFSLIVLVLIECHNPGSRDDAWVAAHRDDDDDDDDE
jgi:hypothetical protein